MMIFVVGLLTFVMVVDCCLLIFLILLQLPKKDAGVGLAFGGSATDALFGAGSGNVLTKVTRYAATIFFVLALVLSIMQSHRSQGVSKFQRALEQQQQHQQQPPQQQQPQLPSSKAAAPAAPAAPASNTNLLLNLPAGSAATNAPASAAPATNKPK
jgi:preprotein translocase subunit SecG